MQKKSPFFFSFPIESTFDQWSKVQLKEKKRRIVERRRKKETWYCEIAVAGVEAVALG